MREEKWNREREREREKERERERHVDVELGKERRITALQTMATEDDGFQCHHPV